MRARPRNVVLLSLPLALAACAGAPPSAPPPVAAATEVRPLTDAGSADTAPPVTHVQILAINDFHGHLEPPVGTGGGVVVAAGDPVARLPDARPFGDGGAVLVPAGGAAYLSTRIARLRSENPTGTIVVSAGDLTGASPLLSNVLKDEPSVVVMNQIGLDLEAVGNHDFDRGLAELERLKQAAHFAYLAANVVDVATQKTVFPPYVVREVSGVKIAFVGETLAGTPLVTVPNAVNGLRFEDEARTANALVPELRERGVSAIVLVLHQGGEQAPGGTDDSCVGFSGDIVRILDALDPAFEVVVTGHTHQPYDCTIGGRLVTSAMSYGRVVTQIDLAIDPAARKIVSKHARNVPVTHDVEPDPQVAKTVAEYAAKAAPFTARVVGWVTRDFTGNAKAAGSASCETPLGDLIADAEVAATGADFAFMNPGGIRADLVVSRPGRADHAITFADAFEVQPFGNTLVTLTLTGAQIASVLQAQFAGTRADPRILQVSRELSYRYTYDRATRTGTIESVRVKGVPMDPKKSYRVTVNSFLAGGGDGFPVLKDAPGRKDHGADVDALTAYLGKKSSAKAPLEPQRVPSRIQGDGCK